MMVPPTGGGLVLASTGMMLEGSKKLHPSGGGGEEGNQGFFGRLLRRLMGRTSSSSTSPASSAAAEGKSFKTISTIRGHDPQRGDDDDSSGSNRRETRTVAVVRGEEIIVKSPDRRSYQCHDNCGWKGICIRGHCYCERGWRGDNCDDQSEPSSPSEWTVGPWQRCSKACGGGVRVRSLRCVKRSEHPSAKKTFLNGNTSFSDEGMETVPHYHCPLDEGQRPSIHQSCYKRPCGSVAMEMAVILGDASMGSIVTHLENGEDKVDGAIADAIRDALGISHHPYLRERVFVDVGFGRQSALDAFGGGFVDSAGGRRQEYHLHHHRDKKDVSLLLQMVMRKQNTRKGGYNDFMNQTINAPLMLTAPHAAIMHVEFAAATEWKVNSPSMHSFHPIAIQDDLIEITESYLLQLKTLESPLRANLGQVLAGLHVESVPSSASDLQWRVLREDGVKVVAVDEGECKMMMG